MADNLNINIPTQLPGEALAIKILEVVVLAMEGQTPEQRKIMWDWFIEDVKGWREMIQDFIKLFTTRGGASG